MFIFPLKNSARKELININSPLNVNRHLHMHVEYYPVPYAGGVFCFVAGLIFSLLLMSFIYPYVVALALEFT